MYKTINDIVLKQTSAEWPEQYDAFMDGVQVGYLKMKKGEFTVRVPDWGDQIVFRADTQGSSCFDNSERDFFLAKAKTAILKKWAQENNANIIITECPVDNLSRQDLQDIAKMLSPDENTPVVIVNEEIMAHLKSQIVSYTAPAAPLPDIGIIQDTPKNYITGKQLPKKNKKWKKR